MYVCLCVCVHVSACMCMCVLSSSYQRYRLSIVLSLPLFLSALHFLLLILLFIHTLLHLLILLFLLVLLILDLVLPPAILYIWMWSEIRSVWHWYIIPDWLNIFGSFLYWLSSSSSQYQTSTGKWQSGADSPRNNAHHTLLIPCGIANT